jgi:hypothetical protein
MKARPASCSPANSAYRSPQTIRKFLKADAADLIIDVTGDPDVGSGGLPVAA